MCSSWKTTKRQLQQIQSIKIGPAADSFKVKKLLKAFLEEKGLEIPIKVSNIPYRNM